MHTSGLCPSIQRQSSVCSRYFPAEKQEEEEEEEEEEEKEAEEEEEEEEIHVGGVLVLTIIPALSTAAGSTAATGVPSSSPACRSGITYTYLIQRGPDTKCSIFLMLTF